MLQCTTPRRPYVMHGVSHPIHVELLHRIRQTHVCTHTQRTQASHTRT